MYCVIKTTFNGDIRRFRCDSKATFNQLCTVISNLYMLKSFIIKYVDDEGDFISVTSTTELAESFRLASMTNSPAGPIVRLSVFETINGSAFTPEPLDNCVSSSTLGELKLLPLSDISGSESEKEEAIETKVLEVEKQEIVQKQDETEYPPLDISDWDPSKKIVSTQPIEDKTVTITVKQETIEKEYPTLPISEWDTLSKQHFDGSAVDEPIVTKIIKIDVNLNPEEHLTISQQCSFESQKIRSNCEVESAMILKESLEYSKRTRDECIDYSQQTVADTAKFTRELTFGYQETNNDYASSLCKSLSDEIAIQCKELSADTTRTLGQMSMDFGNCTSQLEDWQVLSNSVGSECLELCEKTSRETTALCIQISQQHISHHSENTKELQKQCTDLSSETMKTCNDLSSKTTDDCLQTSANIARLILEL